MISKLTPERIEREKKAKEIYGKTGGWPTQDELTAAMGGYKPEKKK